jgi:cobalt/nickel transport system permease protein
MSRFHGAAAGIDHIERLGRRSSAIHGLNAGIKLAVTLLYIALVVSFGQNEISGLMPFIFYPIVVMAMSGTPFRPLLSRLAVALPFALAVGISNMLLLTGGVFTIGGITITRGMVSFASIMLKTAFSVFAVLLLIATTPFTNIAALLTAARPLRIVGLQIVLTYRYIATLLGEAGDCWTAYMLRAPGLKAVRMKDMGAFMGALLLRSFDKAERVYYAMKCRGFAGVYHGSGRGAGGLTRADWVFLLVSAGALCAMRAVNISLLVGAFARLV